MILYCLSAVITLFLWNTIHELSHILAAKFVGNVSSWSIKPYPHISGGRFRFASSSWRWEGEAPTASEEAAVHLAPRIMDTLAILLVIATIFISGPLQILMLIFCSGGIIDLFVGSIGYSATSDLRKAAQLLEIAPWKIRTVGFALCLLGTLEVAVALLA